MPEPTKIPRPFADSGDKNSIPDSSGGIGFASWQEGFPAITSEPFAQGGVAPKRADFNGVFNALSAATVWNQQGGVYAYDATTDYEVGNVVEYSGDLYKCLVANGPNSSVKAPTDTTVWSKVMTAADAAALYLPLSGGAMSGDISNAGTGFRRLLGGSTVNNGARLAVAHESDASYPGQFWLVAKATGVGEKNLVGKPDGTLTWDNKNVETNISKTTAYYRLSNGLQILTGDSSSSSSGAVTVNFAHAFADTPRVMITGFGTTTTQFAPKCSATTTSFDFVCVGPSNNYINGASVRWFAFGIGV